MKRLYFLLVSFGMWLGAEIDAALTRYMISIGAVLQFGGSIFSKMPHGRRNVANGNGATNVANGQISLDLNKDFLTEEHIVTLSIAQAFTGAPTSSDVRRFFSKLEIASNEGTIFTAGFDQIYDLMRFAEMASAPQIVLGMAATANFSFTLHHSNDRATLDLLTALQTANFSTLRLILTIAPDASNGFIGGTGPGVATYQVAVDTEEIPDPAFSGRSPVDRQKITYGKARHWCKAMQEVDSNSTAATTQNILLECGGRVRFIAFHTYNTTGALPVLANGIVNTVSLSSNGVDYAVNKSFLALQQANLAKRNFNQVGVAVLDMGDDPKGWIPLENVNTAKLVYTTLAGTPAGWTVKVCQDHTTGLPALGV